MSVWGRGRRPVNLKITKQSQFGAAPPETGIGAGAPDPAFSKRSDVCAALARYAGWEEEDEAR